MSCSIIQRSVSGSIVQSVNTTECHDTACLSRPCLNGGTCVLPQRAGKHARRSHRSSMLLDSGNFLSPGSFHANSHRSTLSSTKSKSDRDTDRHKELKDHQIMTVSETNGSGRAEQNGSQTSLEDKKRGEERNEEYFGSSGYSILGNELALANIVGDVTEMKLRIEEDDEHGIDNTHDYDADFTDLSVDFEGSLSGYTPSHGPEGSLLELLNSVGWGARHGNQRRAARGYGDGVPTFQCICPPHFKGGIFNTIYCDY